MKDMFVQGGKGSTGILTNKQAVARHFGVKQSEVVYFSVGAVLSGYKVIYDKESQRAYSLPADFSAGTTAISLSTAGVLVHSAGNVDLGSLAVTREEYVTLPGSFDSGVTVNTKNELVVFTDGKYRWDGAFPKAVPVGSTPATSGGVGLGSWVSVGDASLRVDLITEGGDFLVDDSRIKVLQSMTDSTKRTQHGKNSDFVSVKDFGATGDGITDDTAAIQAALNGAMGREIFVPAGIYKVSKLTYSPPDRIPLTLTGEGAELSKFVKIGNSTEPMLYIGKNPTTYFLLYNTIRGLTFDGVDKSSASCIRIMDAWYTHLSDLLLTHAKTGLDLGSPIFYTATNLRVRENNFGMTVQYYAGENLPNSQPGMLRFSGCVFEYNTKWGVVFKSGENIQFVNSAFENNGTTAHAADEGGIYINDTARFMGGSQLITGLTIRDCHSEGTKGIAVIYSTSGRCVIDNMLFFENETDTTNDVRITGGYYSITNCTAVSTVKENLYADPVNTGGGCLVQNCAFNNINVPQSKTVINQSSTIKLPYLTIGGTQGAASALTFQNAATYWDLKQLGGSAFGLYNGTGLINYSDATGSFLPGSDNNKNLGNYVNRWGVVYAGTGSINTSDREAKTDETEFSEKERRVAIKLKALIRKYRFKDAVAAKGQEARWHVGIIAQDVKTAFEDEGLVAEEYGILCYDSWEAEPADIVVHPATEEISIDISDGKGGFIKSIVQEAAAEWEEVRKPSREAGSRYGIRYDELLTFIIASL